MLRVLIIDERPESRSLLRALLQEQGWEVSEASHSEEALTLARKSPPDLAITDLPMPAMEGYTLLRKWKADSLLKPIPLVVYTATDTAPEDEKLALDLGADDFIVKPARLESFLARLNQVLAGADSGQLLANQNLRITLDTEPICLMQLDAEVRLLDISAPGLRLLATPSQQNLMGQSFLPLVLEDDRAAFSDLVARVFRGENGSLEYCCVSPTGGCLWVVTDAAPLRNPAGEITSMLGLTRDISAQKETCAALEESRKNYAGLFESAPIALWLEDFSAVRNRLAELGLMGQDAHSAGDQFTLDQTVFLDCVARVRILEVNRAGLIMHGARSKSELLAGLPQIITEQSQAALLLQFAAISGGLTEVDTDSQVRTLDGHLRDVRLRWVVMPGHEQTYERVLVTTEDITERKQAEARAAHLSRLYATLSQVNQSLVRVKSRQELFPAVCRAVVDYGRFLVAWIGLWDAATGSLNIVAAAGKGEEQLIGTSIDTHSPGFRGGILERALTCGGLALTRDLRFEASAFGRAAAEKDGVRSTAALAFRQAGEITGFMVIGSAETDFFDSDDLQALLREMAADMSFVLDAMETDAKHRRAERAEAQARALAETTILSLPGIFYLFTVEGRFVRWNREFETISGYTGEEIARLHPTELFTGLEKEMIRERIGKVFTDGSADAEGHITAKDGRRTPFYFTGWRIMLNGQPHILGVGLDLTARRQAEASLHNLSHAVNSAGDVVFLTDKEGFITQVNEKFSALYGHRAEDVVGKVTPRILKSDLYPPEFHQQAWATLLGGETVHRELCNRARDGKLLDIEETITPFSDERGQLAGFLAVQREIGERKRAEAEARLLQNVALGMAEAQDLDEALSIVLLQVCEATGWAMGEAWVPDCDGVLLECHPAWYAAAPGLTEFRQVSQSQSFAFGEGLPGRVWQTRRPEWCGDLTVPTRFPRFQAAALCGLTAGLGIPVLAHGDVVLVLGFFLFEQSPEEKDRLELIAAVAAQIGPLIERQRAILALRESELKFRSLFENSLDGLLLTIPDGQVLAANPAACRMLGRSEAEMRRLGRRELVDENDIRVRALLEERAQTGSARGQVQLIRADGSPVEVEISSAIHPTPGGPRASIILHDVTERQRAEEQLVAREAHFRSLIENASDIVTEIDTEGIVLMQGPSGERLLGYRSDELVGHPVIEWVHPEDVSRVVAAIQRAFSQPGQSVSVEIRMRHRNGSWRTFESIGRVVHNPASKPVIIVNSRDMTERRRLEAQLVASERMASMGLLAAGVAHEINNPLAAVIANLDLAARDLHSFVDPPNLLGDLREALSDARSAAEQLSAVARDLRLFSRAEEEQASLVDVRRTLDSAARMAWNEIRHRARLEKAYLEVPPVEANESRLGQAFLNLLVNAAQAIPEGQAEANVIRITTGTGPDDTVVVEITDSGAGITPEVQARMFEPFVTSKPAGIGTGLGLAICQRIVSAAGGRIEVESEAGRGSTFRLFLPAARASAPEPALAPEKPVVGRRGRVLVIDDEPMIGKAITRLLGLDHDVLATTSASEALDWLLAGQCFDVILCDLMMPVMTGIEFYEQLKHLLPAESERIIFLTGGAFTPVSRAFLAQCPSLQIAKPFDSAALRAVVAARVNVSARQNQAGNEPP